jgi:multiple sugar transport system substrate-binding protein
LKVNRGIAAIGGNVMKRSALRLSIGLVFGVLGAIAGTAAQAEPVTLKVWSIDGSNGPGIADTFSKEWNEQNPDIQIDYRILPFDEMVNETLRAFTIGQAPDIVSFDNPDFPLFSSRGAMLDLTDRIAGSDVINADVYFPGPLNSVTWDGRIFGVPKYTNTIALYYNKDMFQAAGIAKPPETWTELAEDAKILTDKANNVYGVTWSARAGEEGTFQFLPLIQMSGGTYKHVNTDGAVAALNLLKGLIDNGYASHDVLSLGQSDSTATFNSGNAAMAISGDWEINRMLKDAKFDWGLVLLPTLEKGGTRSSALGGYDWGIMSTTKHPDEAFKVLEFFVQQDPRLVVEFGRVAPRTNVAIPETGIVAKDAALKTFQEQLNTAQPRGPDPQWQKISKAIYDAIQSALTGQTSAKDALDQAQATIDGILKG